MSNRNASEHFYRAIRKYGIQNFTWSIIDYARSHEELNEKESFWIEFFDTTNPERGYNLKSGGANQFLTDEVKHKIGKAQTGILNHMYGKYGEKNPNSHPVINLVTNETFDSVTSLCKKYPKFDISKVCAVCNGIRKTHCGYSFRYLDDSNNIIQNRNPIQIKYLINYNTKEIFLKPIDAFKKYKYENQDKSILYRKLKEGNGICLWNNYIWYYNDFDINYFDTETLYFKHTYNNKIIKNITTGKVYSKISEATKYPSNLANLLKKHNGHCFYKHEEWMLL